MYKNPLTQSVSSIKWDAKILVDINIYNRLWRQKNILSKSSNYIRSTEF
jgi:hypothetical protein